MAKSVKKKFIKWTKKDREALVKKWLTALRGKKYKQGINRLTTRDDKYCCLGVACDLSIPVLRKIGVNGCRVEAFWERNQFNINLVDGGGEEYAAEGGPDEVSLPDAVQELLGIRSESGEFFMDDAFLKRLAKKNPDTHKHLLGVMQDHLESGGIEGEMALAICNDKGMTFKEIADIIECRPQGLFA